MNEETHYIAEVTITLLADDVDDAYSKLGRLFDGADAAAPIIRWHVDDDGIYPDEDEE